MKILVINGHFYYPYAQGRLNQTMFDEIVSVLGEKNEIKTTIVEKGYDVEEEIEKFKWADIIIFQTPVNWFSFPGGFKLYLDQIYRYGVFYGPTDEYGRGGLLKGKKYMYSLTWNSPKDTFNSTPDSFYNAKSVDEVLVAMHKLQEFCALEKIETFSIHDVVKNPNIPLYTEQLREHLRKNI
jgi:modulator of drug activity B